MGNEDVPPFTSVFRVVLSTLWCQLHVGLSEVLCFSFTKVMAACMKNETVFSSSSSSLPHLQTVVEQKLPSLH